MGSARDSGQTRRRLGAGEHGSSRPCLGFAKTYQWYGASIRIAASLGTALATASRRITTKVGILHSLIRETRPTRRRSRCVGYLMESEGVERLARASRLPQPRRGAGQCGGKQVRRQGRQPSPRR
jgi:hypothetical protein